jgi:hypothetical protein
MAGSHTSLIVMPIVIAISLAFWISLVLYASTRPRWKHHGRAPRTDAAGGAFAAIRGGRQLMPIWDGSPIPSPREAAASESYQAAGAQTAEEAHASTGVRAGASASATGSRPPTESGPTGSGWPPE